MRWSVFRFIMMLIIILPTFQTLSCEEDDIPNVNTEDISIKDDILFQSYFVENNGQWEENLLFIGDTKFGHIGLCNNQILYHISNVVNDNQSTQYEYVFKLLFINTNEIIPRGNKIINENITYIYGKSSENVFSTRSYNSIYYYNIWDNIDIEFFYTNNNIKYNFIVHPGGDVENIKIQVDGAIPKKFKDNLLCYQLDNDVNLFEKIPLSYYIGCDDETSYSYEISSDNIININFENILSDKTLIIDPLIYSTYIGGSRLDTGNSVVLDKFENPVITGRTKSTNFPTTPGAYSVNPNGKDDVYVSKLNKSGKSLDFSTYIGGEDDEVGKEILLDKNENIYVIGHTESNDFPVSDGCYNDTLTNGSVYPHFTDVFILCLNSNGSELKYSTFIGGSGYDYGFSLDIDEYGNIYGTGYTESNDFPTTSSCYDSTYNNGESDAILFKMNSNLSKLLYSTYIGGNDEEWGLSLKCTSSNIVYVTGITSSSDFPTTIGAYDRQLSCHIYGNDCFILKMNLSSSNLQYSTYLGGTNTTWAHSIEIDEYGNAYVTGVTFSSDFPTTVGSYDTTYNSNGDIFISKLNWNGTKLLYSTFIGGSRGETAKSLVLDGDKNIYITGYTNSRDFPTINGSFSTTYSGYQDCFIIRFNMTLNELLYSSYIGGAYQDMGQDICVNEKQEVIIVGNSESIDFPTTHEAFNTSNSGDIDIFVFHLNLTLKARPPFNLTGVIGNGYVQLKWENPNDAFNISVDGYYVYRGLSDTKLDLIATVINELEYNDTTIENGMDYYYYVTCYNSAGESDPSNILFISDTISPEIVMDISDEYATTGEIFHFSVITTDNVLVSNVDVEYWIGEEEHIIDAMQSYNGIHWSSSITIPDMDSTITYFFNASDLNSNWINTSNVTLNIIDNDLPVFGDDSSDDIGFTGDIFKFSINITDNIFVNKSYVKYRINNETINNTESLHFSLEEYYFIITIPDYCLSLKYEFIALDKNENENRTDIKIIDIIDNDKPSIIDDLSDDFALTSNVFTFEIIVEDNIEVDEVYVNYVVNKNKENDTLSFDGDSWKLSINTPSKPGSISYSYRIVDSSNNWLISDYINIPIYDNELPELYNDQSDDIAFTGDQFQFKIDISDNGNIDDSYVHYWYSSGYPRTEENANNISLIRYDFNKYQTETIINSSFLGAFNYQFFAIDVHGNVNSSIVYTVSILDNDKPMIISVSNTNKPAYTGDDHVIQVNAKDNIGISQVALFWSQNTTEYNSILMNNIDETTYETYISARINSTMMISYYIMIVDTSDNIFNSEIYDLLVIDNINPEISVIPNVIINVTSVLNLTVIASDNIGVHSIEWSGGPIDFLGDHYNDYVNVSGNFTVNITVYDLEGNYAYTTFNLTVIPKIIDNNTHNNSHVETIERDYLPIIIIIASVIILLITSLIIGWIVIHKKKIKDEIGEKNIESKMDIEKQPIQEEDYSQDINSIESL